MPATEQRTLARRVAARFQRPWHRNYAYHKLRLDPAYAAVAAAVSGDEQALLDIGCGIGLLGFYLHERGARGGYRGLDADAGKIEVARKAADGDALAFEVADAAGLPDFSGHVALLDVLHYLPADVQLELLQAAALRVAPGAALIIRNVLREPGWRFRATVAEEWFLHRIGWMQWPACHFPTRAEVEQPLRAAGLTVETTPLWGSTPFNSFAVVARREAGNLGG